MRVESSVKNLVVSYIGQVIGIVISLISRLVFVKILSSEYLGLSGLFSNILSMLTLADLGIGTAITYSLYKPLAEKNTKEIKSLMNVYKKTYRTIGTIIFIVGVSLIPMLPTLISDIPDIPNINIIYVLFVTNSAISYFYSYKRTLIVSDQKKYIASIYKYGFYFLLNLIQIIVLLLTHNYILFLVTQVVMTLLENIMVSKKADRMYPYLKEKNICKLEENTKKQITKNISAVTLNKIGSVVINSTDNLIISKYVGLVATGIYSNYYLIINALNVIIIQVFTSITASIGNLAATENKERLYDIFKKIFFLNFWFYSFASICLISLFNDFITIWLGSDYLFNISTVIIIVINFYLSGMRKTVLTFKDALGLYWNDRYKPIVEAIVNLVTSIILVKLYGVIGVFLGTIISTITVGFWVEAKVLYKYGLKQNAVNYFKKYGLYTIIGVIIAITTYTICSNIKIGIINFIFKFIICLVLPNVIYYLIFRKSNEFKYFSNLIKMIIFKIKNKSKQAKE